MKKKRFVFAFIGSAFGLTGAIALLVNPAIAHGTRLVAQNEAINPLDEGVYLLKHGKRFETAITYLTAAVVSRPDDYRARLMLACAQASRAASLSKAVASLPAWEKDKVKYQKEIKQWNAPATTQAVAPDDSPSLPATEPVAPVLRTQDDQRAFALTATEAQKQIVELLQDALANSQAAPDLAQTNEARADALYLRGWVRFLTIRLPENARLALPATQDQVKADFAEAMRLAPQEALYWQSGGDILRHAKKVEDALPLYRKSLALQRKNPALWYLMFDLQRKSSPANAQASLREAIRQSPSNAALWLRLAHFLCESSETSLTSDTDYSKTQVNNKEVARTVLAAVNSGAIAKDFTLILPASATPQVLASAWSDRAIWDDYTLDPTDYFSIGSALARSGSLAVKNGDYQVAASYAQANLTLGSKMLNSVPKGKAEISISECLNIYFGSTAIRRGYTDLIDVRQRMGDLTGARSIQNEFTKVENELILRVRDAQTSSRAY